MTMLAGMLTGLHTQPAVLSDAVQQAKNDLPYHVSDETLTAMQRVLQDGWPATDEDED